MVRVCNYSVYQEFEQAELSFGGLIFVAWANVLQWETFYLLLPYFLLHKI